MERKPRAVVVGAVGYAGAETVRLLAGHPGVALVGATSARHAGRRLVEFCPWLESDLELSEFGPDIEADVFLLCQETGFAAEHAPALARRARVIDLSADFRLTDAARYEAVYKRPWPGGALASPAPYGLPELVDRAELAAAPLVANPGCYATASLLALAPLVRAGLLAGTPVLDGKSGVSGSGRSRLETSYLFAELDNDVRAYAAVGHRHVPEIERIAGVAVRFTPHLIPMARGLEVTLHAPVRGIDGLEALVEVYAKAYAGEPFVQVRRAQPSTKMTLGTNNALLGVDFDAANGFAVVACVLDNLGKGAAGQAVQNMNLMLGLPEPSGLPRSGLWP